MTKYQLIGGAQIFSNLKQLGCVRIANLVTHRIKYHTNKGIEYQYEMWLDGLLMITHTNIMSVVQTYNRMKLL